MKHFVFVLAVTTMTAGGAFAQGERRGPPQEAFDACTGQESGVECTVETPHGELKGTCLAPPEGSEELACIPANHRPPRGQGQRR